MKKLIKEIDAERPAMPENDYEKGYNNGLTMAIAVILRTLAERVPEVEAAADGNTPV